MFEAEPHLGVGVLKVSFQLDQAVGDVGQKVTIRAVCGAVAEAD